jgi:hypothetical protein
MALSAPHYIPAHLVRRVESFLFDQALRKTQCHRRVIGPLAGSQSERPAARNILDWHKAAWRSEFESCPQCVARGQAEQASSVSI